MEKSPITDLKQDLQDPEYAVLYGAELTKNEFAVTLARARLRAGITQKELAEKLSLTQPYIAKLERGDANPTLSTVGSLLAIQGFRVNMKLESLAPEEQIPQSPGAATTDIPQTHTFHHLDFRIFDAASALTNISPPREAVFAGAY